ncbi:MAG: SPFH domain-containing protein [Phycisphaerae bacterium]|nr:SPFH domain-containing protein [Phycisphaerae bacterium]
MSEHPLQTQQPASDPLDVVSQRRGKHIAIAGFVVQLALSGVLLVIWKLTDSLSAMSLGWLMISGSPLWLMSAVLFYVRQLACQETLELEQISRQAAAGSIFEANDISLRPAASRVAFVLRWVVPIFSLALALYLVGAGLMMIRSAWLSGADGELPISQAMASQLTIFIFATVGVGFAAFLFSRYATGLGSQQTYRPLRATGSYLLVCVLGSLVLAVALMLAYGKYYAFDRYFALALPAAAMIVAVEMIFNFVLDIYRPRVRGQEARLAYDSRLLNLLAEPGRVGHGMAEALNYQFGFEVSKTWFYQLLSRALAPLMLAAVLIMVLLTSVVIVPEGDQAVVFVMGKAKPETLKSGLRVKLPWPLATAEIIDTSAIHEILLGTGAARTSEDIEKNYITSPATGRKEVQLWTTEHGTQAENDFLVAVPASRDNPAAVNVIKLVTCVQYVIDDPFKYSYTYDDARALLESVAYQEMVRYLASATLLEEDGTHPGRPQAIMTTGRQAAAVALMERIRGRVGPAGLDLGVAIVNVDFQSVHPPASAAEAFEKVLAAERGRDVQRYEAQKQANLILAQVAGTPSAALRLAFAIDRYQNLESLSLSREANLAKQVDTYLKRALDDLATLREEIERDELSGKAYTVARVAEEQAAGESVDIADAGDALADKRLLREEYRQYIATLQALKADPASVDLAKALDDASRQANELFAKAQGEPARLLAEARADRWSRVMAERARAETFDRELAAFEAAPQLYVFDRWMDVMDQTLPDITKKIIAAPRHFYEVWYDQSRGAGAMQGALEDR